MRIHDDSPRFSASDLANHLACRHLTGLNLEAARGRLSPPLWHDPAREALAQRGFQHEAAYVEHLRSRGLRVMDLRGQGDGCAFDATVAAMHEGADVIVQATLSAGAWYGRADVLLRVPGASRLGAWSYEVVDTKLSRETRAGTILQLCLYSDIVRLVQERLPERMHVVPPSASGTDFVQETYRVNDYLAYYRFVQERLEAACTSRAPASPTYPEPVAQCDVCRWWSACERRRREDDHLSRVAGISKLQRLELSTWGVQTLTDLARLPLPLERKPTRGAPEGYIRVREQARVQLEAQEHHEPVYELLPREPERGLARLPSPSAGDIFFDIEGDPFVGNGGLEYLFGWAVAGAGGSAPEYHGRWATDRAAERSMFETFVDLVMERWARFPDLHIYHFAVYEPGAMKRLMGRYATREDEVDRMLRAGLFVDLYSITKQALRAGIERYSIKELEPLYGYARDVALRDASLNLRTIERALELGEIDAVSSDVRATVESYNRDDCISTLRLRDWLEQLRSDLISRGEDIPRPAPSDGAPSESIDDRSQRVLGLMDRLLRDVPALREQRSPEQQACWLLAHMLDWHRREEKAPWWEYFRLAELDEEELLDQPAAVAGLQLIGEVGGTDRCPIHRYRYPAQDVNLSKGDPLRSAGGERLGTVDDIDLSAHTIDIKKRGDAAAVHPRAVFAHSVVDGSKLAESLFRLGEWVAAHGIDAPGPHRAARDLLLARPPRLRHSLCAGSSLQRPGEPIVEAARRLVRELDGGVLAIQGPPGSGKTHTGARMACELVRAGKKVGVTAVSHKVIRNFLDDMVEAAIEQGVSLCCIQKVSDKSEPSAGGAIRETTKNPDVLFALQDGTAQVAAGTAWLWSREDLHQAVDTLFVDEAGQMSLANVLAVAPSARNIVLLGDPQQLDQPLKGSHPEGTEASALQHLLGDKQTIPADRGLFLAETRRLHPAICAITSELFYEGRLASHPDLVRQAIHCDLLLIEAGLWFAPVEHEGNHSCSLEEVERVAEIYAALVAPTSTWTDACGVELPMTQDDVLIVAPYNVHVNALRARLPGARIGTVDKFQGQEAPIVLYSMATSTPEEVPHGMEFLFSLNRLNVAISRARCAAILVASPRLLEIECRTPRQVQLANAFCRYRELAKML